MLGHRPHVAVKKLAIARAQARKRLAVGIVAVTHDHIPGVIGIDAQHLGRSRPHVVDPVKAAALNAGADV